jgi:hypothetical protein
VPDSQFDPILNDRRSGANESGLKLLHEIHSTVTKMDARMESMTEAFVKDDLGKPDYHGHRKAHLQMIQASTAVDTIKMDATKKVVGVVAVFMLALVGLGFVDHIKTLLK